MLDLTYPMIIPMAKTWFRTMGFKFRLTGVEHIPKRGGALLAFNHISYVDFIIGGYAAERRRRRVRFMAKKETFDHPVTGPLMRSFHHIEVDRGEGVSSAQKAVDFLRAGEVVGIFPEATISRSFLVKDIKTGATRIAAEAGVPVIPIVLWGSQRVVTKDHPADLSRRKTIAITVGEPLRPTGENAVQETAALKASLENLLDQTIRAYPAQQQPPGSWWLPASYGGSAPTPEQAKELDSQELRQRIAERRAKQAKKGSRSKG